MTGEQVILALEAERRAAMMRGDAASLAALLHEDACYYPGAGGRESARSLVESVRDGTVRYLDIKAEQEEVNFFPGVAVVTGLMTMDVEVSGEFIRNRRRFADIWLERTDGWRLALYFGAMVEVDADEIQAEIEAGIRRALASGRNG